MNTSTRFALGQSIGLTAFVWGYPLVESLRTCRLQTSPASQNTASWQSSIDQLNHVTRVSTHADRDVVTPANDLLFTTGWINLANGPRLLHVPAARAHPGRYFVLALYDAWTNNFDNPGLRLSPPEGQAIWLVSPHTPQAQHPSDGRRVLVAPTDLVWLIARVLAGAGDDVAAAQALQRDIRLECPRDSGPAARPASVEAWSGPPEDTMAAWHARPGEMATTAAHFFNNLCRGLATQPVPPADQGLADWLARNGLVPDVQFDCAQLPADLMAGLAQGLADGAALLVEGSRSRKARPWSTSFSVGRYDTRYLVRALTAYKGLGALAPDEAVYSMSDFDSAGQPYDGRQPYRMRFAPGEWPPVDGFWSVTLYDADRFLYANDGLRHSIGDRTQGLLPDADGGLTLHIAHQPPADGHNWLPAPAGPFYLVLRMYLPRPEVRTWPIPPVQPVPVLEAQAA